MDSKTHKFVPGKLYHNRFPLGAFTVAHPIDSMLITTGSVLMYIKPDLFKGKIVSHVFLFGAKQIYVHLAHARKIFPGKYGEPDIVE